jgi:hypothetical protein
MTRMHADQIIRVLPKKEMQNVVFRNNLFLY